MKIHRPRSALSVLLFMFGIMGGLLWESTSTLAAPRTSRIKIPIAGTVHGSTDTVLLSGTAQIVSTVVLDTLLGEPPREIVSIKLVSVSGVGLFTGTRYVVATGQNLLLRPLVPLDRIEITVPLYPDTAGGVSQARSVLASFTLEFDLPNGALTGGTATFSTPSLGD